MSNHITDLVNGQEFESASPLAHAVRYDRAQVKTEEQKKQARENIGCYCEAGGGGGGGGALMVNVSQNGSSLVSDKTWQEIYDAAQTGPVIIKGGQSSGDYPMMDFFFVTNVGVIDGVYGISVRGSDSSVDFMAASADGYPAHSTFG